MPVNQAIWKENKERVARYAARIALQHTGAGYVGIIGNTIDPNLLDYVDCTAIPTTTSTVGFVKVGYANVPAEEFEYFKPGFAKHLIRMEFAPIDNNAPVDEQEFMDWLTRD